MNTRHRLPGVKIPPKTNIDDLIFDTVSNPGPPEVGQHTVISYFVNHPWRQFNGLGLLAVLVLLQI